MNKQYITITYLSDKRTCNSFQKLQGDFSILMQFKYGNGCTLGNIAMEAQKIGGDCSNINPD